MCIYNVLALNRYGFFVLKSLLNQFYYAHIQVFYYGNVKYGFLHIHLFHLDLIASYSVLDSNNKISLF